MFNIKVQLNAPLSALILGSVLSLQTVPLWGSETQSIIASNILSEDLVVGVQKSDSGLKLMTQSYDLSDKTSLADLRNQIKSILDASKNLSKEQKKSSSNSKEPVGIEYLIGKKERVSLVSILNRIDLALENQVQVDANLKFEIGQLLIAFGSNYYLPAPVSQDVLGIPGRLNQDIGKGILAATNVPRKDGGKSDPTASTFWSNPGEISDKNLYYGFGRTKLPQIAGIICKFEEAKGGYGLRPGADIVCDGQKLKLKWGTEIHTDPINTRIFNALGYNTAISDSVGSVSLKYNREFIKTFNERETLTTKLTAFFGKLTLLEIKITNGNYNPFDYIKEAVLKDGTTISGKDLQLQLMGALSWTELAEQNDSLYNTEFEQKISHLNLVEGAVKQYPKEEISLGAWDWNQNEVSDLREFRGAGLLAAWLNSFDVRWDNNKLKAIELEDGSFQLRHTISDLGAGLGTAPNMIQTTNGDVNAFPWTFTLNQDDVLSSVDKNDLKYYGMSFWMYNTIDKNDSFRKMNIDDARWMARKIAKLSKSQITQALAASGMNAAQVVLYTEKLDFRRNKMFYDLGLSKELGLKKPRKTIPVINFEGDLQVNVGDKIVTIKNNGCSVVDSKMTCQ